MGKDQRADFMKKHGVRMLLGLLILLGVMAVLLFEQSGHYPSKFLEHLFMALAVAGFIGLVIEFTLQRQIARNVFEAAIGYLLPDALRDELRWIYGQKLLCVNHVQTVHLTKIQGTNLVKAHCVMSRKLENISDEEYLLPVGLGIDEWFHEGHPSKILSVVYQLDGEKQSDNLAQSKLRKHPTGFDVSDTPVLIQPGKTLNLTTEFEETYLENDVMFVTYSSSTMNPTVMVYGPEDFEYAAHFGSRQKHLMTKKGDHTWQLDGVLLPHQDIRIRWWKKEQSKKWLETA